MNTEAEEKKYGKSSLYRKFYRLPLFNKLAKRLIPSVEQTKSRQETLAMVPLGLVMWTVVLYPVFAVLAVLLAGTIDGAGNISAPFVGFPLQVPNLVWALISGGRIPSSFYTLVFPIYCLFVSFLTIVGALGHPRIFTYSPEK